MIPRQARRCTAASTMKVGCLWPSRPPSKRAAPPPPTSTYAGILPTSTLSRPGYRGAAPPHRLSARSLARPARPTARQRGTTPPMGSSTQPASPGSGRPNRLGYPRRPSRRLARSSLSPRRRPLRPRTRPVPDAGRCPSKSGCGRTSRTTWPGDPTAVAVTSTSRSTAAPNSGGLPTER
jgi:hypothetical protein